MAAAQAPEEETGGTAGREAKQPGHSGYAQVADDDKQMDRAVENAQKSLGFFMAALQRRKTGILFLKLRKLLSTAIKSSISGLKRSATTAKNFTAKSIITQST